MLLRPKTKALYFSALLFSPALLLDAQTLVQSPDAPTTGENTGASQLGFTSLRDQANALVEEGKLSQAMPLLKELVDRVEKTGNKDIKLDFPIFLIGTGHIQNYVQSKNTSELSETLRWYEKLEKEFPNSPKIKDMVMKRKDIYRVLGRNDDAIAEMQKILSGGYPIVRLSFTERVDLLRNLTQIYYNTGKLAEGLPTFAQLLETSRDKEDKALAAAASFEALFEAKRLDDAIRLLPMLARESDARYSPRLNVALLKASDTLVEAERLNDAALTLNLIKTTDLMIEFFEEKVANINAQIELRKALGNVADEKLAEMRDEVTTLEGNLERLRELPTLRNELLVRRARNYTKTSRKYEAFWMFNDLMKENPDDDQAEFFHYATFSNALEIGKTQTAIEAGRTYRSKFPNGEFYSDVSGALASLLRDNGLEEEFVDLSVDFLGTHPQDAVSRSMFALWASYLIEEQRYAELIYQAAEWYNAHKNPIYEDGIFYWGGLAELQLNQFEDAIGSFSRLVNKYPTSLYAEDGLLRKGTAEFYAQLFDDARVTLYQYVETYPDGEGLDQAYFFLGEVEFLAGNLELALQHFYKADEIAKTQDIHDGSAFRIGAIFEELTRYEEMASHFEAYIDRFGEEGDLTRAVLELGRAYEYLMRPVEMLALYRENIEKYAKDPTNAGVDALIESYAEKYDTNQKVLSTTVAFFDKVEGDPEFREKFVTDRGFLFEAFYNDRNLDPPLYNRLRRDPNFTEDLIEDLSPIEPMFAPYREQLAKYPQETPEEYFRDQLAKAKAADDFVGETRMLMGLYRLDIEIPPSSPFNSETIQQLTPRAVLYVADYERKKRLSLAEEAWNHILINFPADDAAIVAFMRLAAVAAENERYPDALNYLDQIVTQFPGSPKVPAVMLRQGEILSKIGRGAEAREKYQYMLRVTEWRGVLQARALFQTGESYMAEGKFAEAHGFFERTFLGYPHLTEWSARAYMADAEALVSMGAKPDAITTLQEAVNELGDKAPEDVLSEIKAKLKELQS